MSMQKSTYSIVVMNDEEISRNEKEILRHFENLKAGLLKALKMGVFQTFDETAQMKISITVIENFIEKGFVGVEFDK